jgi:serine/threonine protein kinase HipA of HipAB toxin-antitoxin module
MSGDKREERKGARATRERSGARRIFSTMTAAGASVYARSRDLPRLIALWPHELIDESVEGHKLVLAKLRRALRAERRRAISGHWSYDLNRHLGLVSAYKGELTRLKAIRPKLSRTAPAAPSA